MESHISKARNVGQRGITNPRNLVISTPRAAEAEESRFVPALGAVYGAGSTLRLEKYASVLTRDHSAILPRASPSFRSFTIRHGCVAPLT